MHSLLNVRASVAVEWQDCVEFEEDLEAAVVQRIVPQAKRVKIEWHSRAVNAA